MSCAKYYNNATLWWYSRHFSVSGGSGERGADKPASGGRAAMTTMAFFRNLLIIHHKREKGGEYEECNAQSARREETVRAEALQGDDRLFCEHSPVQ